MTRRAFAERMNVSPARVSQWRKENRLVLVDGKIDGDASEAKVNATGRQRNVARVQTPGMPIDPLREAKTRSETARADQAELEAKRRAGELVLAADARRAVAALADVVVKALDALPARVGATLAAKYGAPAADAITTLRTEITAMRHAVLAEAAAALK
jgi:hypothetical protein